MSTISYKENMKELIISNNKLFELMYKVMIKSGNTLPDDVKTALEKALETEEDSTAKLHLSTTMENIEKAEKEMRLACADTGYPLYYIKIGNNVTFEEGIPVIYKIAKKAVSRVTKEAKLRPTMVHPLYRTNPGDNVGHYIPKVELRFDNQLDGIEITAVPKGGGSEIFGTFYKMMVPADGKEGIIKFILDCAVQATYAGKICPPAVIGVGIGGTADICTKIAKEAAVLRPIGSRHPEEDIANMELELLSSINSLGIGPMGFKGKNAALDVHIEYAVTHTASLPVAFNAQCSICRRATVKLKSDGLDNYDIKDPDWHYR